MNNATIPAPVVSPTVVRHPACDDPRWTELPTRFTLLDTRGSAWTTRDTLDEAIEEHQRLNATLSAASRQFGPGCTIVESPYAPPVRGYGEPRRALCEPWAGGTWHGGCGAMIWVCDPDATIIAPYRTLTALNRLAADNSGAGWLIPQSITSNAIASSSQTHHLLGNAAAPGFYYECQQPHRHLGNCGGLNRDGTPDGLGITWERHLPDLIPAAQPVLF